MKQKPLKIFLLGSGNVATQLGYALTEAGFIISGIFSRNPDTGQALATEFNTVFTADASLIPMDADIYILAVKDDAIAQLNKILKLPGKIVVHTSGTVEAMALGNISDNYGVFYPLQTFRKSHKTEWKNLPVCIEGANTEVTEVLKQITLAIHAESYIIDSDKRRKLHLAAVWVNNFTNYLLSVADDICQENDIPFSILEPLAKETVRKAFAEGPFYSQSGPALRGDAGTLEKHLKMLGDEEDNNRLLYVLLSKAIRKSHKNKL
jgi:predicted short-subunit dehydrogenase-like oxidoreductase (DUF2520 family)